MPFSHSAGSFLPFHLASHLVYAVKKILLEAETRNGEVRASTVMTNAENEKLRREVTTISMMSHMNIVRWVRVGHRVAADIERRVLLNVGSIWNRLFWCPLRSPVQW